MRRIRGLFVAVIGSMYVVAFAAQATASPAAVVIDSRAPALTKSAGGGWTVSLGFANASDAKVELGVTPADAADKGCVPTPDKTELPAAEHTTVTVTVPAGCSVGKDGFNFTVSATPSGGSVMNFDVTAAPKPQDSPDWSPLAAFPIALAGLMLAALIFYVIWDNSDGSGSHRFTQPLQYLEASWSFKDSWVSNVTVGAALLTGVFGSSDVVKALLGTDADRSIALATVGVAIAAAFVGAGPLLLAATKSKGLITAGGLLAASAFTLAGAAGELWVVYSSARNLDLGGWQDKVYIPALVAAVLLAVYGVRSIHAILDQGTTAPSAPPPSDTIVAAHMIVAALKARPDVDERQLGTFMATLTDTYPSIEGGPAATYVPPRRAAIL